MGGGEAGGHFLACARTNLLLSGKWGQISFQFHDSEFRICLGRLAGAALRKRHRGTRPCSAGLTHPAVRSEFLDGELWWATGLAGASICGRDEGVLAGLCGLKECGVDAMYTQPAREHPMGRKCFLPL